MNLDVAHVFDAMRRQAIKPRSRRQGIREFAAIEQDLAFAIAADEVAEADGVVDRRPAMRVDRNRLAYRNVCVEHAHSIVFENQPVMFWRGDDGVELGGIRPGVHRLSREVSRIHLRTDRLRESELEACP